MTFPTLTPTATTLGELYFATNQPNNIGAGGSTPGCTFIATTIDGDLFVYDQKVVAALTPVASQSPGSQSAGVAVLFWVS